MANTDSPYLVQFDCRLLQLPRELRDKIYDFLFTSTRVTFGERSTSRHGQQTMKPAAHSLALLRVCRQIFAETKSLWIERLLFNFEDIADLLDKLCSISAATHQQIRHVRTRGHSLMLSWPEDDCFYRILWALKLLPDLQLDRLTILGSSSDMLNHDTLQGLVLHGNGWKELNYITKDFTILGFKGGSSYSNKQYWRQPQPNAWEKTILSRDGANSKASVIVYQATENKSVGSPFNVANSRQFEQIVTPADTLEAFGGHEDVELMSSGNCGKDLLVVVRRGDGTDIFESAEGPYHERDIRSDVNGMTWPAIKREHVEMDGKYDGEYESFLNEEKVYETDVYYQVDEYVWDNKGL